MNLPVCKTCHGRTWRYYNGDPTRYPCTDCKGTGRRAPKPIARETAPNPITDKQRSKIDQKAQHKMDYLVMVAEASGGMQYVGDAPAGPCQTCLVVTPINKADFSHKHAAGMGGAGDVGGIVLASNGTYSCRCCHGFIEQDIEARNQHEICGANMLNGLQVRFSEQVEARWKAWCRRWYKMPETKS